MKKLILLPKKPLRFPSFLLGMIILTITLQAQDWDRVFNDDDPLIEQPTRESMSHFRYVPEQPSVITINDYDNFDVGIDYWEQHATSNHNNPLWLFFGVNATGSPQNARGSTDGGITWYLNNPLYPGGTCCDPWSAYTGSGVLIYASGVNGQYVYRSTNNGLNWGPAILSVTGNDRNHVSAEYTGTGPYANYVYAAMTPGNFGRSTDAGLTWTQTFTTSNSQPGAYIAVGPNGSTNGGCVIYVSNTGATTARVYNFFRSTDGGTTFSLMSSLNAVGYMGTYNSAGRMTVNNARSGTHPKAAMDNSNGPYRGRLYLVYATNDPPGNGNRPDVWLQYSTDQGATWAPRVRVNDNADPTASDQWFPEIWCERETGTLFLHWYDDRNAPATFGVDVYATYTTDGGATFAPNQRITNATFNYPCPACSPNTNCYRGDYTGITANPHTSFSIWGDHRNCNAANMGAYFPDFAMRVLPNTSILNTLNDSSFHFVAIPGVKLWTRPAKFSATVTPAPSTGTITLTLMDRSSNILRDSLTSYPDSLRLRIKTSGGVTEGAYTVTIKGNGPNGTPVHIRNIALTVSNVVGLSNNEIPVKFSLSQNYPNPFNPVTKIKYQIAKNSFVTLKVYDILGKKIMTLVGENLQPGTYEAELNGSSLPSGIYFYELRAGDYRDTKKMMLVK